ncbi:MULTISPECIES: hypothetical protein [unclassified Bradyrhizobium]|uniref:hypothetical protein n=1 Tax=unclassified Bradyrhizobium TaxID=2631580 RepID=UPI002304323B|nr:MULTISPECIES: hypothetical protein [unclassified Bradyrhizobium]
MRTACTVTPEMPAIDLYRSHTQPLAISNLEPPRTLHAILGLTRHRRKYRVIGQSPGRAISDARRPPGAIDGETYAHVIMANEANRLDLGPDGPPCRRDSKADDQACHSQRFDKPKVQDFRAKAYGWD